MALCLVPTLLWNYSFLLCSAAQSQCFQIECYAVWRRGCQNDLSCTVLSITLILTRNYREPFKSMHVLPREVCTAITYHAARADLIVLSRTSRTLQRAAERKIYEDVNLQDPAIVFEFCKSLIAKNGARGVYVRRFWFMYEPRRRTTPLPRHFWQAIHAAFVAMVNLELLWISDPDLQNSWVLADTKFQLVDASLIFAWDQHLVRFLQRQTRLRVLYTHDAPEDSPICTLPPGSLPALEQYLGPLTVAGELLQCPLTHLQVIMDDVVLPILPSFLADAGKACKRLRSLSILSVLEPMLFEVVQLVLASVFAPRLRYLGTLAYPCQNACLHYAHYCLHSADTSSLLAPRTFPVSHASA